MATTIRQEIRNAIHGTTLGAKKTLCGRIDVKTVEAGGPETHRINCLICQRIIDKLAAR